MDKITDNIYKFTKNSNNSYLIKSDVNIIIDGVGKEYADEYINDIAKIVSVKDISYIVINHCEMNRMGTLKAMLEKNGDIKVIATTPALKLIDKYLGFGYNNISVKDGMELLGLKFILTPYINWPDSMVTVYNNILFSCDLFSSTILGPDDYYNSYLSQRPQSVLYAVSQIQKYDIACILTGSGMPIKDNVQGFIDNYKKLADTKNSEVLILYHSVYGNTYNMAKEIENVLADRKISYQIHDMGSGGYKELAQKIDNAKALILGTDTVNADAPADLWNIIALTNKVTNKFKPCMLFGTYAWSGEGLYFMEHHLKMLRYNVYDKPFGVVMKMDSNEQKELVEYTKKFINSLD